MRLYKAELQEKLFVLINGKSEPFSKTEQNSNLLNNNARVLKLVQTVCPCGICTRSQWDVIWKSEKRYKWNKFVFFTSYISYQYCHCLHAHVNDVKTIRLNFELFAHIILNI